ncbi:helix-turn-helix transcriptional regulator [Streptomyces laurentii]|uniref:helix-turn-helix transcriptional regulator n=1 Tax=Streptomyces laurentii TaxID=39478 RepID=UPI0036C87F2A
MLETLAREAGMSRTAFAQQFKELVGESPMRHLMARRLQEAKRLLSDTSVAQQEIAQRVGYRSQVGFHRAFRQEFDMTPGAYRSGREVGREPENRCGTPRGFPLIEWMLHFLLCVILSGGRPQ